MRSSCVGLCACSGQVWLQDSNSRRRGLAQVKCEGLHSEASLLHAGVGLYYGEDIYGVPPVLLQFVSRTPVLYEVGPPKTLPTSIGGAWYRVAPLS